MKIFQKSLTSFARSENGLTCLRCQIANIFGMEASTIRHATGKVPGKYRGQLAEAQIEA